MIFHNPKSVTCRELKNGRLPVSKEILGLTQRRFQKTLISDPRTPPIVRKQPIVDSEDKRFGEPKWLFHLASSLRVFL